jgi:hypothetical protein
MNAIMPNLGKRQAKETPGRVFLVLWKWEEAERLNGFPEAGGHGKHSGGLRKGDRMFVWATKNNELFILGAIRVERSGKDWATGKNLYGPFQIIPLQSLKWKLRFQNSASEKLSRRTNLAMQVRSRRQPTPQSVSILEKLLSDETEKYENVFSEIEHDPYYQEGRRQVTALSKIERNPKLRAQVLAIRGCTCEVCNFDFTSTYGDFARRCIEVHHLKAISSAGNGGVRTKLKDVLVVCPNCHRALHRTANSSNWRVLRKEIIKNR